MQQPATYLIGKYRRLVYFHDCELRPGDCHDMSHDDEHFVEDGLGKNIYNHKYQNSLSNARGHVRARPWAVTGHHTKIVRCIHVPQTSYLKSIQAMQIKNLRTT